MHFQKNALWWNYLTEFSWKEKKKKNSKVWGSIPHEDSELFLCPTLVTRRKKSYSISLPSSKLPISISSYKYDAIDIADPSSMQDKCHMNFIIDLAHRWVFVTQW